MYISCVLQGIFWSNIMSILRYVYVTIFFRMILHIAVVNATSVITHYTENMPLTSKNSNLLVKHITKENVRS